MGDYIFCAMPATAGALTNLRRLSETGSAVATALLAVLFAANFLPWFLIDTGADTGRFVPRQIGGYNFRKRASLASAASADNGIQALNVARVSCSRFPAC